MTRNICALFTAATVAALVVPASAAERGYQGTLCSPAWPMDTDLVYFGQYGVHNDSESTTALVACGATPNVGSDVYSIEVTVYDRNENTDVCCNMQVQRRDGTIVWSADRCSTGSADQFQVLDWVPPVNAADLVNMECSIPTRTEHGLSHVTSYRVSSNP